MSEGIRTVRAKTATSVAKYMVNLLIWVNGWMLLCSVCDYSERQLALLLARSPMKDGMNTVRARTIVVIAKYIGRSPLSRTGAATAYGKAFNFSVVGDSPGVVCRLAISLLLT